jgi:serine palmitoyltransferase
MTFGLLMMELDTFQDRFGEIAHVVSSNFQKLPGSAMLVRYIQSSYQNDPVRSAIELVLVLFFIRYLMSPSYSTHKQNFVKLREAVRRPSRLKPTTAAFLLTDCLL